MNQLKLINNPRPLLIAAAASRRFRDVLLSAYADQIDAEKQEQFAAVTDITSLAITKLDGTAKGGVVIGISDELKVPVKYIGLGEGMDDLQLFNKRQFVDSLFGS